MAILPHRCLLIFSLLYLVILIVPPRSSGNPDPVNPSSEKETAHGELAPAALFGYVEDVETGEPLTGAGIYLPGTTTGASSDPIGYFQIDRLSPGTYTFRISYLNYESVEREITIVHGQEKRLDIKLYPSRYEMDEVTVTSSRNRMEQRNLGRRRISVEESIQTPSVLQDDLFRSIQLLPGVAAASDFSSGLHIRGGGTDQTLIRLDQATVYNPSHFFGFFSTFNSDAISDVDLYKGTYPAEYGGRLGSVIDISNRDGSRESHGGVLSLGMLSSRIMAEGPLNGKGSYLAAFRRSTMEPILHVMQGEVDGVPDQFYFYDLNARVSYDLNGRNRVNASIYSGTDDVQLPFDDQMIFNFRYGNRTFNTTWTHFSGSSLLSRISLTGSQYFNYPFTDMGGTPFDRNNRLSEGKMNAALVWFPNTRYELSAGAEVGRMSYSLVDSFNGIATLDTEIRSWNSAFYVQGEWRPVDRVRINSGVRVEHYGTGDYWKLGPRVSTDVFLTPDLRLQAGYGRYYQYLSLVSNPTFSGFDVWVMAGEKVAPSCSDQFAVGLKYEPRAGWEVEVEGYYRTMNDLFEFDPLLGDVAGFEYHELFRTGDGYAYGLEAMVERTKGRLTGYVGYTFGRTWRRFPEYNQGRFFPPRFDRTHDLTTALNYRVSSSWRFSTTFTYQTGQPYTQPVGRSMLSGNPLQNGRLNHMVVDRVNGARMPAYHRLDIAATRRGSFFGIAQAELQIQVINVYSRRNVWFYTFDYNQNPPQKQEMPLLPILPSVTYTIEF
ncbi:TonB-dependent receptor [Balneolales bacterium ANBcel1]|nr:TonB-dependent receptor [Balneolales bacterium ANBcel1]